MRGRKHTVEIIECACGCGQTFDRYDRHGHPRKYVYGHGGGCKTQTAEEKLWKYAVKAPGCWSWTGAKAPFGYGVVLVGGKMQRAHRLSYMIHVGPIPEGMNVLHHCDNPECCNPEHLFIGTSADNVHDAQKKGRLSGPIHISRAAVIDIRNRYLPRKVTQQALADAHGCSRAQVGRIIARQNRTSRD